MFFERYPHLLKIFGDKWVNKRLVPPLATRHGVPPLFWALATERSQDRLANALRLVSLQVKIEPIVRELRSLDEDNVASLLSELELFRLLRRRYTTATWKPRIGGPHAKRPDLSLVDASGGV